MKFSLKIILSLGMLVVCGLSLAEIKSSPQLHKKNSQLPKLVVNDNGAYRKFIVAIDPGHGGEDAGACGVAGNLEKEIVFKIALNLRELMLRSGIVEPLLTRQGDYYVGLRERTRFARKNQADLLVSIHADGFDNFTARGATVFTLSERGASSEMARWVAAHENRAELAGGTSLRDKDEAVAEILLDLTQTATKNDSQALAQSIFSHLKKITIMHKNHIEHAGFVVLKSPDIPSILIETGFISTPSGEAQLANSAYQKKIAQAIYAGIAEYLSTKPRPRKRPAYVARLK